MANSKQRKEDWMNSKWRPTMGWMYMAVCLADFIVFPVLWSVIQAAGQGQVSLQWQPITLQGAGLFHVAMGAVLGVTAYGRTQEKIVGVNTEYYLNEEHEPVSKKYSRRKGPVQEPDEEL